MKILRFLFLFPALLLMLTGAASAGDINWISKEDLKALLDDPDTVVIDVRTGRDWDSSDVKVHGAVREEPTDVAAWAGKYPKDKRLVFY